MEAKVFSVNHQPGIMDRLLPALAPMLLTSIGYVDPGKWAATIEGGARFGFDLVGLMLVFNCAAILCQYLSARIGVVTGRNLAEICSDEYDKATCIFLGVTTEFSVIALDLTMVLGIAHGLNLMLGLDLFTSVFLTAVDVVLFPLFATLLENYKGKLLCICLAGFILILYVLGVLVSQPEIPVSMNGMLTKLSGESAFALMSLLGANILPHNFYLHSSIVQQYQEPQNVPKGALCHDHFFAILSVFSGIFLANFVLMNSAATEFYSTGLVLLNFQDAMSLMDQVFRSPISPFVFVLVLLISNQITALNWKFAGRVVLHGFFGMDIPSWIHRATIRAIAIVLALYCIWNSGAEGLYQLLIFTQVMVALLLPSSVIPLIRVASSRPIMGVHKISQIVEFLALITFIGILGLNIIFVVEMIFGSSDWVGNLRWNMGSSSSVPYVVLLSSAVVSLCLMLWLAATPLKSASVRLDTQEWNWDIQNTEPESSEIKEKDFCKNVYSGEEPILKGAASPPLENTMCSHSDTPVANIDLDLPETIIDPAPDPRLTSIEENDTDFTFPSSSVFHLEESSSTVESIPVSTAGNEVSDVDLLDTSTLKTEIVGSLEKTVEVEENLQTERDDDEGDTWEPEEISKGASGISQPLSYDGPGSFKSLSAKTDEGGSGTGSLSRLAGLGRAARRQLAAVLDEFWGQLYDFHGQATHEAKAKKLDVLLGVDSNLATSSLKVDTAGKEFAGYFPSVGGRGSDSMINSSLYDSPKQQRVQSGMESTYGIQRGPSSLWSNNHRQLLDAYVQNSSRNILETGERRYASLRLPPPSDGWDHQPMTVHGYQISSYVSRMGNDKTADYKTADYINSQMEIAPPKSMSSIPTNYRNSLSFSLGQKPQNGLTSVQAPGFPNLSMSRNSPLQSERSYYDIYSSGAGNNSGIPANSKKYYSLPDISGLSASHRDSGVPERSAQWSSPPGFGPSTGKTSYDQPLYNSTGSRAVAPLSFDELSPSKVYKDAFSLQLSSGLEARSLWSRQPFEQFGVAEKPRNIGGEGNEIGPTSIAQEAASVVDVEVKLLKAFRLCILKLLKLEGSDWLFRQNDGADEDLVDRVAARERFLYEVETREMNREGHVGESQYSLSGRKYSTPRSDEAGLTKSLVSSVPHCGEGCVWRVDLITSFGVWCIHRILDLSLMESRPELWGKYTYVLNRLQGIVDLAFSKPRTPSSPCFCLQVPISHQQKSSPPVTNGMLPPASKPGRGKCTTAATLLDIVKDVEMAISCRKGRTGTAAGDVAFPKGKENLASVLKRYKRRLSNKLVGSHESGSGSRKVPASTPYGL